MSNQEREAKKKEIRNQWEKDKADVIEKQLHLKNLKAKAQIENTPDDWTSENDDGTLYKG